MLPIGASHGDVGASKQGPSRMVSQLLQLLNPAKLPSAVSAVGHCDHPLDPLTAEEVNATSDACKAYAAKLGIQGLRFNAIALEVWPALLTQPNQTCNKFQIVLYKWSAGANKSRSAPV